MQAKPPEYARQQLKINLIGVNTMTTVTLNLEYTCNGYTQSVKDYTHIVSTNSMYLAAAYEQARAVEMIADGNSILAITQNLRVIVEAKSTLTGRAYKHAKDATSELIAAISSVDIDMYFEHAKARSANQLWSVLERAEVLLVLAWKAKKEATIVEREAQEANEKPCQCYFCSKSLVMDTRQPVEVLNIEDLGASITMVALDLSLGDWAAVCNQNGWAIEEASPNDINDFYAVVQTLDHGTNIMGKFKIDVKGNCAVFFSR